MKVFVLLAFFVVAAALYVRLAPSDPARWHVDPTQAADPGQAGALMRVADVGSGALARFDKAVQEEPRSLRLQGAVAELRVTYVVRSRWFGFPDYITATQDGSDLVILSRLRFGLSDLGVNQARLERLLERL